jgi:hypothetical protein
LVVTFCLVSVLHLSCGTQCTNFCVEPKPKKKGADLFFWGVLGDVVSTLDNTPFLPRYLSAPADRKTNSLPKGFFYRLVMV